MSNCDSYGMPCEIYEMPCDSYEMPYVFACGSLSGGDDGRLLELQHHLNLVLQLQLHK